MSKPKQDAFDIEALTKECIQSYQNAIARPDLADKISEITTDCVERVAELYNSRKTDLLIINNGTEMPEIHASNIDMLGSIVHVRCDVAEELIEADVVDVAPIGGTADQWLDELTAFDAGENDVTAFMTSFIEQFNR